MRLVVAPTAFAEIEAILAYVVQRSPQGAARISEELDAAFASLLVAPRLGRPTSKACVRRLVLPHLPYLVFYEIRGEALVIIAVRHAARRPDSMPAR